MPSPGIHEPETGAIDRRAGAPSPRSGLARWSRRSALLLLLTGCGGHPEAGASPESGSTAAAVVDAAGRTHDVGEPPSRILSLVPSATAVLLALGEGARLVGRTDFDTARALAHLPSVGGGLQPDLETLVSLAPELVILFHGPSDPGTRERLDRLGIRHFAVRPDNMADVGRIVTDLGAVTHRGAAADSLLRAIEAALDEVRERVAGRPPVRAVFVLGGSPPWVAGAGTFVDELMRLGGGVNVFSDLGRLYAPVSPEALVAREVDVYLALAGAELDPRLLRGAPVRRLGGAVQLPGPDLAEAAREVARALHPGAFP